ncbi:MAG: LysM domain-containing protein/LysM domain-containing protein [Chloroflexi bacterium]|nr:MAG: LysM domain-containing protein/LysM domain-containing protein [Chloroflexota bacterium]
MVAQRWPDDPADDGYDNDLDAAPSRGRTPLTRRGDAAAIVPVASRDGASVRLRRRARFVEAARPTRPGRRSGSRPQLQPQARPHFAFGLSHLAGTVLAVLIAVGLVFTVLRSNSDGGPELFDAPAVAVPATAPSPSAAADASAAAASAAAAEVTPALPPDEATSPAAIPPFDDLLPPATVAPTTVAPTTVATVVPALDLAEPAAPSSPTDPGPVVAGESATPVVSGAFAPDVLPPVAVGSPIVAPFAGYDLPPALVDWPGTLAYTVQPGDLLGAIALNNRTTSNAIAGLNGLTDASHLRAGESLQVPVGYVDPVSLSAVSSAAALLGWTRTAEYTVRDGDSLRAIAETFFTSEAAIALINDLPVSDAPAAGTTLQVPWGFTLDVSGIDSLFGS